MEQQEQRRKFVNNFTEFCKLVVLNKAFMDGLEKHPNREYLAQVKKLQDDSAKKTFIFLEFTKGRYTCREMIEILRNSGKENAHAANELEGYNTSPKFILESDKVELDVTHAIELRSGDSKWFDMDGNPRGKCLIINNVKKSENLDKESLRFEYIFKQLFFDVELCYDMKAEEMNERLKNLAKEKRLRKDNALVIMIISHGYDDHVEGVDKKVLNIFSIVDLFSDENCKYMEKKPKLFFFNCCRYIPATGEQVPEQNKRRWKCENQHTMINFACAEGNDAFFNNTGFTFYGQALSHCIAQYACDKSVQSILSLTHDRLADIGPAEVRSIKMNRELFLNPGLPKKT